jgi:EamA domain-containing membrane protein RarD
MKPTRENLLGLMTAILALVLVGGVLVAYLWETLNQLMSGHVDWLRVLISLPVLAALFLLLRFMARRVEGWSDEPGR